MWYVQYVASSTGLQAFCSDQLALVTLQLSPHRHMSHSVHGSTSVHALEAIQAVLHIAQNLIIS